MPSASFYANFDQFDRQVESAKQTLGNFEISCRNVQGSIKRIETAYDGSKLIGEAVKTAAAIEKIAEKGGLTEAELRKLSARFDEAADKARRVGQEMPDSFNKVAESVKAQLKPLDDAKNKTTLWGGALTSVKGIAAGFVAGFTVDRILTGIGSAVTSTIEWGGALTDMAAKTGVSTTALQRWEYAAKQGGNTLDQVVTASVELSKRLADGDKSTVAAIEKLGLNFQSLRSLSPERQFDEVASAIAHTANQGDRAAAAVDLLGKSGKDLLPTLTSDIKALGDEAERLGIIVDEKTLQAMDELGDSWQKMKDAGRGLLAEVISPLIPGMNNLATAASNAAKAFREDWLGAITAVNAAVGQGGPAGLFFGAAFAQRFGGTAKKPYLPSETSTLPGNLLVPRVTTSESMGPYFASGDDVVAGVRMVDIDPKLKAASEAAAKKAQEMADSAAEAAVRWRNIVLTSDWLSARMGQVAQGFSASTLQATTPLVSGTSDIAMMANQLPGLLLNAPSQNYSALMRPPIDWSRVGLSGLTAAMPFLSQLTTGGSRAGQIGGSIGGSLGGILGSSSMFGQLAGMGGFAGFLGAAAPFMGPALGLLGGVIGKLFGPSRGAILGREADQRMDQTRASLLQQYGSLDAIRATGAQGAALADAWGSRNVQGEQWFNERVRAFEEQNRLLGEQRDLESQIAGIEAQRTALNDSLKTTWDQVVEISGRYGISLEGLGAQVRQLGATTTWTSMLNDIEALTRAGGDMGGILLGMQDEINALVRESLRLGTEIPENMRPYVQALMDAGRLTDANKNSIRDINALRWGPAVQTQADIARTAMEKLDTAMQTLVDRLNAIIDRLANGLPAAAEQGARGAGGALSGIEPPEFRGGSVESFDTGGLIERTQIAQVHRGELIGPVDFMARALAGAMSRIGTGGARVVQVVLDRRVLAEALVDEMPGALRRAGAF